MSLLDKFENVEIKNETRIAESDIEYCKTQQQIFDETLSIYNAILPLENKIHDMINNNSNSFLQYHSTIDVLDRIESLKESFKNNIFYYFSNKYHVTLASKKLKTELISNYNQIIDEIFVQLDGYSFSQMAKNEIVEACKQSVRRDKITVNKNKLSVHSFFSVDDFSKKYGNYEVSYYYDEDFYKLFKGLSYYCFKSDDCFCSVYEKIVRGSNDEIFTTHQLCVSSGCMSIKLFKNGKIEMLFDVPERALEFAKTYLGYVEMTEEEREK